MEGLKKYNKLTCEKHNEELVDDELLNGKKIKSCKSCIKEWASFTIEDK